MGKIKFVYFDIGEVLVRGAHTKDVATFLGVPEEQFRPVLKKYQHDAFIGKITAKELLDFLKEELPLDKKLSSYPRVWVEHLHPIHESHKLVHELSQTHKIGFLTNLFTDLFDELKKNKLVPEIENSILVGSWEVGLVKPDEAIYMLAQEKAGVQPEEILFIDDNKENVAMAKRLGWQGIVFDPHHPVDSINQIKKML